MRLANRIASIAAAILFSLPVSAQVPDYYAEPGLNPNRDYQSQNRVEHIDPFTGSLRLVHTDINIPGNGGLDLTVQRIYNSVQYNREFGAMKRSVVGMGWSMHYGRLHKVDAYPCTNGALTLNDNPVFELPDGTKHILYNPTGLSDPQRIGITTSRWTAKCDTSIMSLGLIITSPEGTQYTVNKRDERFAYLWHTTEIRDKNDNTLTISYTDDVLQGYRLVNRVLASDGREVTFQYTGVGTPGVRLASVTNGGWIWTYNYTLISGIFGDHYRLDSVTRPDGYTWDYAYNGLFASAAGSYELQQLTYPYGGTTTYSYDFVNFDGCQGPPNNTVVTQKVNGGPSVTPGTWTFAYAPDWSNGAIVGDRTTVTTPAGKHIYDHFGFTTGIAGTMWKIGLPLKKETQTSGGTTLEVEEWAWGSQIISDDDYNRHTRAPCNNYTDLQTFAPILTQRKVTRDGTVYTTDYSNHDAYGNPQTVVETGNASRTTTLTYYIDTTKWIVKQLKDETISGLGSITRTFDSRGNLTGENRYGVNTTFTRTSAGDILRTTNARSFFTTYGTYQSGIPLTETQPESRVITRKVDTFGNISSETDGEGRTTTYQYDSLNRPTRITPPLNAMTTITWPKTSGGHYCTALHSKQVTRSDFLEYTCFDGYGRVVKLQQRNSSGSITVGRTFTYDALGRKTFESYPGSASGTNFAYDALNRLTTVTHPGSVSRSLVYQSGNKVRVTNERGKITTFTYRSYGNPESRALMLIDTPVANADVTLTRNLIDQILTVNQDGKTTTYGYNSSRFLTSVTQPEIAVTTYGRDAVGNMSTRQVGSSGVTSYTYDGLNRLTFTNHPGSTPDVRRGYDRNNRMTLLKTEDGSGATITERTYAYNWNGNLQTETLALDGRTFSVGYGYTNKDQLTTITHPSTLVASYAPDALGRPVQATPGATSVSHHPSGQVSSITFANAAKTDFTFNNRYWPLTLIHRDGALAAINSITYGYDGIGNVTSIADTVDPAYARTLSYDDIDRLVTANATGAWGTGSFSYSGRGDILTQTLGSFALTYAYDGTSKLLTSVSGSVNYPAFTYDVYGNVTGNGVFEFAYDDTPNMTCSDCTGAARADYVYDGKGMRVKATKNGVTTYSFYAANGNLLFDQDAASTAYSDYLYLNDKLISKQNSTATLYYHDDMLGSPIASTDAVGALSWRENYRPYGTQLVGTGNAANDLWYTGKSHDQDTKLSYMGARYYDTQLGRFMGVDPALFNEKNLHSVNRYVYGNNNPLKFKDPTGEAPIPILLSQLAARGASTTVPGFAASTVGSSAGGFQDSREIAEGLGSSPPPKTRNEQIVRALGRTVVDVFGWARGVLLNEGGKDFPPIPADWAKGPGEGWEWRGAAPVGGREGAWVNPDTGWSVHNDTSHKPPKGPHVTATDKWGRKWDNFGDGWNAQEK